MDMSIVKCVNSEWPCNKSVASPLPSEQAGVALMASSSTCSWPWQWPSPWPLPWQLPCAVPFTVGGLSVIIGISGSHSENLPVICNVGDPISNDYGTNRILHHTIWLPGFNLEYGCFHTVTCVQVFEFYRMGCYTGFGWHAGNLPVICSVGVPNSNDYGTNRILHHIIWLPGFSLEYRCFHTVTCVQVIVNHLDYGQELIYYDISLTLMVLIDYFIFIALMESKPVYINISGNLAAGQHVPYSLSPRWAKDESWSGKNCVCGMKRCIGLCNVVC